MRQARVTIVLLTAAVQIFADAASDVKALTNRHTRIIWAQRQGKGDQAPSQYFTSKIMGLDTDDGKGERVILGLPDRYCFMFNFTRDGERFVYNLRGSCSAKKTCEASIWIVDFDGANKKKLKDKGAAGYIRYDAKTGKEWVYYREQWCHCAEDMRRFQLDNPRVDEKVTSRQFGLSRFSVSADGRYIGGESPSFGNTGILDLHTGNYTQYSRGCWASLTPDNSYYLMESIGGPLHCCLQIFKMGEKEVVSRFAPIGFNASQSRNVQDNRWTNDPQFITFKAPDDREKGEVYIAKLESGYTGIEKQVRVTNNNDGSLIPEAWIKTEGSVSATYDASQKIDINNRNCSITTTTTSIKIAAPGNNVRHLMVYAPNGATILRRTWRGNREIAFDNLAVRSHICIVTLKTGSESIVQKVFVAR